MDYLEDDAEDSDLYNIFSTRRILSMTESHDKGVGIASIFPRPSLSESHLNVILSTIPPRE